IYHFNNDLNFTFENYLWWVYLNLIFGLPLGIIINLINQYFLLKKHVKAADILNNTFRISTRENFQKETGKKDISLEFEKEHNSLNKLKKNDESIERLEFEVDKFNKVKIGIGKIIYIEAFGNYINIIYNDNGIKKVIVRETITKIERKVIESKDLYRTHRSYLVNLKKIDKIDGDSQGLKLHLELIDKVIPVSRNKIKEFRKLITTII
ncbi:MAG: LytTR family DNA-binding domain-containing protein, partial [Ignavibacteriaceae bacterium]